MKKNVKAISVLLWLVLLFANAGAQTKKETLAWISDKFYEMKLDRDIIICCTEDGTSYCYRTRKISVIAGLESKGDTSLNFCKLFIDCNYDPSGVPSGQNTNVTSWHITLLEMKRFEKSKITRVTIERPEGCWRGSPYFITFYSNKDSEGNTCILRRNGTGDYTPMSKITFAVNLDQEENLAERMQKAFDHLFALEKKERKEKF